MPYPNEHSARVRDPDDFQEDSFRRIKLPGSDVWAIVGRLKGEKSTTIQAYRFPKDKFTVAEAKAWLKEHGIDDYSFEEAIEEQDRTHDAILQTLDRESNGIYLNKELFQPTLDAWAGVPLIWAQDHPEIDAYNADPEAELARIGGRIVGKCAGAYIDTIGHPRLMGRLVIDDPVVEAELDNGAVSLSTGFLARSKANKLTGIVRPHHILLFREIGSAEPGDKGAFILNMDKTQNEIEQTLSLLDKLKAKLARIAAKERPQQVMNQGEDGETEMPAEWDEERVKALEEKVASLDEAVTNMRAEVNALAGVVKDLQGESESFLKREKDMKWNEVKAHVAPGLVHKDREAEMRKLWENDPASFVLKALTYKEEPPKAEGIMFTAKDGTKIGAEEQLKRLRIPAIDVEGVQ